MADDGTGDSLSPGVHINLNIRGMKPSSRVAMNERCNEMLSAGRRIFKLGLGQSPFPVPEPVVEELKANAYQKDYLAVKGLKVLREAVSDYHRRTEGTASTADDVLIGPGSKELMFLLQLAQGIRGGKQLCAMLLEETGVAILPGEDFGRAREELTARMAYVDFDGAKTLSILESAGDDLRVDEDFLRTHCPNVVMATERMCEWVS